MADAVIDLHESKTAQALAQLDRAEKVGFADIAWLNTVRTLAKIRDVPGPDALDIIKQLDGPAYLSGPPERSFFLALIYCSAQEVLKIKHPELAEKANKRAAALMSVFIGQGKSLPPSDRSKWSHGLRGEQQLRPFYAVLSSSNYANLSARAIAAKVSSKPQLQTAGDGREPK